MSEASEIIELQLRNERGSIINIRCLEIITINGVPAANIIQNPDHSGSESQLDDYKDALIHLEGRLTSLENQIVIVLERSGEVEVEQQSSKSEDTEKFRQKSLFTLTEA